MMGLHVRCLNTACSFGLIDNAGVALLHPELACCLSIDHET